MVKFNHAAYMNKECSHREYYGQFVSAMLISHVVSIIGGQRINASTDEHLNDIPLAIWDRLAPLVKAHCGSALADSNASTSGGVRSISLADCVCVAKEAARQYKETV